jgi:hypothetical protein
MATLELSVAESGVRLTGPAKWVPLVEYSTSNLANIPRNYFDFYETRMNLVANRSFYSSMFGVSPPKVNVTMSH